MRIECEPDTIATEIRQKISIVISPVATDDWATIGKHRLTGYCFFATKAYYETIPDDKRNRFKPYTVTFDVYNKITDDELVLQHCYLYDNEEHIIDITRDQFMYRDEVETTIPYDNGEEYCFSDSVNHKKTQRVINELTCTPQTTITTWS